MRLGCTYSFAVLFLALAAHSAAIGWGPEGHKVTALIAEKHLERNAKAAVKRILGSGGLADVANIADEIRNERAAPWHFVNIPVNAKTLDRARFCLAGNCVVAAAERFRDELKRPDGSPETQRKALYNLVHFVGDLHQPLHCADRHDRGGNDVKVRLGNRRSNLHRVWDSDIIEEQHPDFESFARALDAAITGEEIRAWSDGTPESWALESHRLAREVAYRFQLQPSGDVFLGQRYVRQSASVIDLQLCRAGIRLAFVLNRIFQ
ncbi:MAG: S1/P1 nuclease [Acidobacteria bacterium]|nr:S1/P1 nuclease [Acidobacteriota bacterium]